MLYLAIFIILLFFLSLFICFLNVRVILEYIRNGWDDHIFFSVETINGLINFRYEIPLVNVNKNGIKLHRVKKNKGKKFGKEAKGENKTVQKDSNLKEDNQTENNLKEDNQKENNLNEKNLKENNQKENDNKQNGFSELFERVGYFKAKYDKLNFLINHLLKYLTCKIKLKEFKVLMTIGTGDACATGILTGFAWMVTGIVYSHLSEAFPMDKKCVEIKSDFDKSVFNANILCIFSIRMGHIIKAGFLLILKKITSK